VVLNYVRPSRICRCILDLCISFGSNGSNNPSNQDTPKKDTHVDKNNRTSRSRVGNEARDFCKFAAPSQIGKTSTSQCSAFFVSTEAESSNQGDKQEIYKEKNAPNFLFDPSSSSIIDDRVLILPLQRISKIACLQISKKALQSPSYLH
jgi:hypothetical protein